MAKSKGGARAVASVPTGKGLSAYTFRRYPELRPFQNVNIRRNENDDMVIGDGRLHAAGVFPGQGYFFARNGVNRVAVSASKFNRHTDAPFEVMIQKNVKYSTGKLNPNKTVVATYLPYNSLADAVRDAQRWLDGIDIRNG